MPYIHSDTKKITDSHCSLCGMLRNQPIILKTNEGKEQHFILPSLNEFYVGRQIANMEKLAF